MTYDELPAGREMDGLVAEKVMEWQHCGRYENRHGYCCYDARWMGFMPDVRYTEPYPTYSYGEVIPCFSSLIDEAWRVVKKMRERGLVLYPLRECPGHPIDPWEARFVTDDDPCGLPWEAGWSAWGKTPMEAICRAALAVAEGTSC